MLKTLFESFKPHYKEKVILLEVTEKIKKQTFQYQYEEPDGHYGYGEGDEFKSFDDGTELSFMVKGACTIAVEDYGEEGYKQIPVNETVEVEHLSYRTPDGINHEITDEAVINILIKQVIFQP